MTNREKEIFDLIKANPMISQNDLSRMTGITRTSVAVHISNLIKKGYILGKGYVTKEKNKVSIIGGINIDIGGKTYDKLVRNDSNPGKINITLGGVGRNIAHNLSLLGIDTYFFTAFGDDIYADKIIKSCEDNNIDISFARKINNANTPIYLFINDTNGNMDIAVSDMDICEKINIPYLSHHISTINSSPLVFFDTNISQESIEYLSKNVSVPIFVDPVSTKKALKLVNSLNYIHTLKPNKLETEILSGVQIKDKQSLIKAAKTLLDKGIKRLFITLGGDGVLACCNDKMFIMRPYKTNIVNTTGAGDAFTSALVYSYINDFDLETTCKYAQICASIACQSNETINDKLSKSLVEDIMNKNKCEIEYI